MKESNIKKILKNQIFFCEHNLVKSLHLTNIFRRESQLAININLLISSGNPEEWATELVQNSIKDKEIERQKVQTKEIKLM